MEQVLTRILDAAAKLSAANAGVAGGLADRLNADPEQASFEHEAEACFGVAVMAAGKRLRPWGTGDLVRTAGEPVHVAIHLYSQPNRTRMEDCPSGRHRLQPDRLNPIPHFVTARRDTSR